MNKICKIVDKGLNFYPVLCYHEYMRQKFDIGDLVEVVYPHDNDRGIILDTKPINAGIKYPQDLKWHPDEYSCKVQFITKEEVKWVRAKWLNHLSRIDR